MRCSLTIKLVREFCSANYTFTMVRHGQSIWNKEKRWAGWTDVPLSSFGIKEVKQCAKLLKDRGMVYDVAYTSMLGRAIRSTNYILEELDLLYIPVHKQWRLNQKHYGQLQGCSKVEINQKFGTEKVNQWRRSLNIPPPPLDRNHETHPINNPVYKHVDPALLPNSQCLADIINRVKPLWEGSISADIKNGKKVLIVAHGSSLRALAKLLYPAITEEQLKNLNFPNATPIIFTLDSQLKAIKHQYLGDEHQIHIKMQKIKNETQKSEI